VIVRWGADELPEALVELGIQRPFLVASPRWSPPFKVVGTWSEVPSDRIQDAAAAADGADGLLALGGGSAIDLAKAISVETGLPLVSVPTTYSGAELTPFFGMTDPAARQKTGGGGPTIAPIGAIYDAELTLSTPPRVSAETGMNALAHCVEVVYSPTRTPEAEAIGLAGAKRIVNALPLVVDDPDDVDVRASMFEGAALAGRCLQNGSMGVHHGLAQLVGGRTGIAHGLANAVILPHVIRFNGVAAYDELERLGEAIGAPDDTAGAIAALVARLGLPAGLGECGVTLDDLDAVARLSQSNHNVRNNIRPVSEEDARAILAAAY